MHARVFCLPPAVVVVGCTLLTVLVPGHLLLEIVVCRRKTYLGPKQHPTTSFGPICLFVLAVVCWQKIQVSDIKRMGEKKNSLGAQTTLDIAWALWLLLLQWKNKLTGNEAQTTSDVIWAPSNGSYNCSHGHLRATQEN